MNKLTKTLVAFAALAAAQAFANDVPSPKPPAPAPVRPVTNITQTQVQTQEQSQTAIGTGVGIGGTSSSVASASGGHASAQGGDASNSLSLRMDAQLRDPVSTATASALAVANGTCMGSTSAGVQSVALGVSIGGTWVDKGCDTRYDTMLLVTMGLDRVARQRLCQKPEIERAMKDAGMPCQAPVERRGEAVDQPQHTDPIVRQRLGLPPL